MSCCSASTSTAQAVLARGRAGDRADRDDPRAAPAARPPSLEEEADGGAGGEGHVVASLERGALRVAERLGARCRRARRRRPGRRARAARRAARRAPRPRARRGRAARRARTPASASTSASATNALGHDVRPRSPCSRERRGGARARSRRPSRPASARASRRAASASNSRRDAVRAREADERVLADPRSARAARRRRRGSIRIAGRLDDLGAQLAQPRGQPARLRAGARDGDRPAPCSGRRSSQASVSRSRATGPPA